MPLGFVDGDRDRSERLEQIRQSPDVVAVGVREEDCLDFHIPPAHQVDHQLRFEVGVDDHCIFRVLVFDKVRVGAELAVGGGLDANLHEASLATVCTSFTPSSFSIRRESCARESISTVVETTAVLSSYTCTSSDDILTRFSPKTVAMSRRSPCRSQASILIATG